MEDSFISLQDERTEEVHDIIEKMPSNFGFYITAVVVSIILLLGVFGWIVKYPDVVSGQITINTNTLPLRLIANSSGRLKLHGLRSSEKVKEGQVLAMIDNSASIKSVYFIDSLLKEHTNDEANFQKFLTKLPKDLTLGELNIKFYSFINNVQALNNFSNDKLYEQQINSLLYIKKEQDKAKTSAEERLRNSASSLHYFEKFTRRDSVLFTKKVISESELDKSQMSLINARDSYQSYLKDLINIKQSIEQTASKIQELAIQEVEQKKELTLAVKSSYNDLVSSIRMWEQKYVFKAPFAGKVQFLKFYTEDHFVQSGEQIFTLLPMDNSVNGQVILPSSGAGKIEVGQETIIKLDYYPYLEFGTIKGKVKSISLTTSELKAGTDNIDAYLIFIDLPNQLVTNHGSKLSFKAQAKGTAEIITKDRRLIQRLFDNLKYSVKDR